MVLVSREFGSGPQAALTFSYQYGYPIYAYGLYVRSIPNAKPNVAYPHRNLASPEDHSVVRPNVDTLYTPLFYDLSQSDLEFTIPSIPDRFWLWPWYDMYGNNFGNIGSLQGFRPGKYLLRLTNENFGVQTANIQSGYQAYVNSPTAYGMLLNRILVKERTDEDLAKVHALQDQMAFKKVPRIGGSSQRIPQLDLSLFGHLIDDSSDVALGNSVLKLTAALSPYNPPEVLSDRFWVAQVLEKAGVAQGFFQQRKGTDMAAAVSAAHANAADSRKGVGLSEYMGNNWTQPASEISGDFRSFYAARMFSAYRGYLILTRDQAAYPAYTSGAVSGSDRLTLTKKTSYLLEFPSGPPKLKDTGFWSLTIYGGDQYLIPNPLKRYNVGDRSGLNHEDGTSLQNGSDKGFKVLIQAGDVEPPLSWTSNWLPGPIGGGVFTISFRFYGASPDMMNGRWEYPVVSQIDAIVV